jgi:hypothetical protein
MVRRIQNDNLHAKKAKLLELTDLSLTFPLLFFYSVIVQSSIEAHILIHSN